MLVYLNDIVMQIKNDEASLINTMMDHRIPKMYNSHPIFIEVGRLIEIIACGRNLVSRNFDFSYLLVKIISTSRSFKASFSI